MTETRLAAAAMALTFGDLLVATGGVVVLPQNVTVCGGSMRVFGQMFGVQVFLNCTSPLPVTGTGQVYGCKSMPSAVNYNPLALVDDGSCIAAGVVVPGCTYPVAANYDPLATTNNGSCTLTTGLVSGCMCPNAGNYAPAATLFDNSCDYSNLVRGCSYANAFNYDGRTTVDDGSCVFADVNGTLAALAACQLRTTALTNNLTDAKATGATCASNLAAYTSQYTSCLSSSSACQAQVAALNTQLTTLQANLSACSTQVTNFNFVLQSCQLDVINALALSQPAIDRANGMVDALASAQEAEETATLLLGNCTANLTSMTLSRDACNATLVPCQSTVTSLNQQVRRGSAGRSAREHT